jgi:hypothetical protein
VFHHHARLMQDHMAKAHAFGDGGGSGRHPDNERR